MRGWNGSVGSVLQRAELAGGEVEGWQLGLTLLMAFTARVAAPYAAERAFVFCWTVWNSKIRSFSDIAPQRRVQQPLPGDFRMPHVDRAVPSGQRKV